MNNLIILYTAHRMLFITLYLSGRLARNASLSQTVPVIR